MSVAEKLTKIRSSPKLQGQEYTAALLSAIDDTLNSQNADPTPAAYFAALLSLLSRSGAIEKEYTESKDILHGIFYLLDLVSHEVSEPLLRSKYSTILPQLSAVLTHVDADAPLVKSCIGALESLLLVQDAQAWKLPMNDQSPRQGLSLLLIFAHDARPKVRKRALEVVVRCLESPPPTPLAGHPALDMCAEIALHMLQKAQGKTDMIHILHMTKAIATACKGWPSKSIEPACRQLLDISRSSDQHVVMACFEVFEAMLAGMSGDPSEKLPQMLQAISQLQPSKEDTHLLPTWVAVLARAYEMSSQADPQGTYESLPEVFELVASFLTSPSQNIRLSAAECLNTFTSSCIPSSVLDSMSGDDILARLGATVEGLLSVKFQSAWMEVFTVIATMLQTLKSKAFPVMRRAVDTVGNLRGNDAFAGKKEADLVLSNAITAVGPQAVLKMLPLNLKQPRSGQAGRAWLLPLMRTSVKNTKLAHFKSEMLPLAESFRQRIAAGDTPMQAKIFETLITQVWAIFPGYCMLPVDLVTAFDDEFAELLATGLYQQPELRNMICQGLRNLVESNRDVKQYPELINEIDGTANLAHLASFANQLLAVLFNVYSQTLPQNRIAIVECINAYLGILPTTNLVETFDRVAEMLKTALAAEDKTEKDTTHTLMDLVVIMASHLPQESFQSLSQIVAVTMNKDDPQLQKKAYKMFSRLALSDTGAAMLKTRNADLQQIFLAAASKTSGPARRERLVAISLIVPDLCASDLHFIPSILSEVIISVKETNEKAREAAFDLLVLMGQRMALGGTVVNANMAHMADDAPSVPASLEEYFTMVSAGLAGSTPHMISATITALARLLYEFQAQLPEPAVVDLVQTIDLFLTSQNREIVRSCLGFVKVCVLSLSTDLMQPRLATMIPNLCVWSHEHKAQFKAKVKHIFERLIRRFGVEIVSKYTPAADAKLVANIRKTKERAKRRKDAASEGGREEQPEKRKGHFESEFDRALYASDDDDGDDGAVSGDNDSDDDEVLGGGRRKKTGQNGHQAQGKTSSYIIEGEDEPLDLLDKQALAHVSSTKPIKRQASKTPKRAMTDEDGKLILNGGEERQRRDGRGRGRGDDEVDMDDDDVDMQDKTLGQGIDAYVDAIRGTDAAREGQRGRLKFNSAQKSGRARDDDDDDMDVDDGGVVATSGQAAGSGRGGGGGGRITGMGRGAGRADRGRSGSGRGAGGKMQQRKGLGAEKQRGPSQRGGRVSKPAVRGRGGARARGSRR